MQRLLEKELVIITGRNENLPGKPLIYTTSKSFMDYFGINSADDLPKIKEILAEQAVEATYLNNGAAAPAEETAAEEITTIEITEGAAFLAVTPDGELITAAIDEEPEAAADGHLEAAADEQPSAAEENQEEGQDQEGEDDEDDEGKPDEEKE